MPFRSFTAIGAVPRPRSRLLDTSASSFSNAERWLLKVRMRKERRNVPAPSDYFIAFVRKPHSAGHVVAYHIESVGKRWAIGSFVCPAKWNPMPGKRILFLVELRVPTGHNPVVTLRHGTILSEWKACSCGAISLRLRSRFDEIPASQKVGRFSTTSMPAALK